MIKQIYIVSIQKSPEKTFTMNVFDLEDWEDNEERDIFNNEALENPPSSSPKVKPEKKRDLKQNKKR